MGALLIELAENKLAWARWRKLTVKTIMQFVALGSSVIAVCLGIWLQQMPSAMIGSYWQCDAMTLLTIIAVAAQLTAMLVSKNDALKQAD